MNIIFDLDDTLHDKTATLKNYADYLCSSKINHLHLDHSLFKDEFVAQNKIRALGFEPYFDFIVTSGETGIKKPYPEIFRMGLNQLGKNNAPTCFCGDSLSHDIKPAKQLGLTTIWKTKDATRSNFADYVFDHFSDYDDICETIRRRSYPAVKE
ncbi:HAD-IA family hydrolase [Endozoicomonas arenosclerae]|uniref:HAD-IA family hydrolase n=1 Tax=Endozoicomonas arenosclerae TaxID=1633495 RepID=UPI0007830F92|nr:HAD-IA family hydrolase [Endozoicomonas arenosclerae]